MKSNILRYTSVLTIMLFILPILTGCAGFQKTMQDEVGEMTLEMAVKIGTSRALKEYPNIAPLIQQVSADAINVIDDNISMTLPVLEKYIKDRIDYTKLTLEEEIAIDTLLKYIRKAINAYIVEQLPGAVQEDYLLSTKTVLTWVNEVAIRYIERQ